MEQAAAAERAGDFSGAKVYAWRAHEAAERDKLGPPSTSNSLFRYGRMAAYLCQYDEARDAMQKGLAIDEQTVPPNEKLVSGGLFELARLDYAHENWDGARRWYDRAVPLAWKLGGDRRDPIWYADELDRYALVLQKTGDAGRAVTTSGEAAHLRAIHPGKTARLVPKPYPKCGP
ncbi:MAG TPA: tetratricopeptide repeat protein [Myxococcota bacterium]|nr:tetratricopeptide repeat protein [Myxococcota bacterium]